MVPLVAPEARPVLSAVRGIWYSPLPGPIQCPLYASAALIAAPGIWYRAIYTTL